MKLSEAILEGAKLRPQAKDHYFSKRKDGQLCSCAIGAAFEAICGAPATPDQLASVDYVVSSHVGLKGLIEVELPEAREGIPQTSWLLPAVYTLNDDYGYSREQIAAWLEGLGY